MRVLVEELKKAVQWIETNSTAYKIEIEVVDSCKLEIKLFDKFDCPVEIILFEDNQMQPKVRRSQVLR